VRLWIEAPISSCVAEWLIVSKSKCGLGVPSWKNRFEKLLISKRFALKNSPNVNIKNLWSDTNGKNIQTDSLLTTRTLKEALNIVSKEQKKLATNHLTSLSYQGLCIKAVTENIPGRKINLWAKMSESLTSHIYNFVRKAIQSQLPTLSNLVRWGRESVNLCPLCNVSQTNKHVLSNCSHTDVLKRYLDRHNTILTLLANWFKSKITNGYILCVDLPGSCFKQTQDLLVGLRPDIVIMNDKELVVTELTICHETNLESSKQYKDKYKNLHNFRSEQIKNHKVSLTACEVSVLGFVQLDSDTLSKFGIPITDDETIWNLSKSVITSSFDIYTHRDTPKM